VPARLLAREGPLEGATFPLPDTPYSIGREERNTLCLAADRRVSRQHCVIESHGGRFHIRDLGSANSTYVNDVPIEDHVLEHGEEVRIGQSVFIFLVEGLPVPDYAAAVDLDEDERLAGATLIVRRDEAIWLRPERVTADGTADRIDQLVKSVLTFSQALSSVRGLRDLERRLLQSLLDIIPARRAAMLLVGSTGPTPGEFASAFHRTRDGHEEPFRIPRAVIRRASEDRAALCLNGLMDDRLVQSETIRQARVTSAIAAPVLAAETMLGVIYLDASDASIRFTEDDLHLVTALAEAAAAPLAQALSLERVERDHQRLLAELAGDLTLVGASEPMRAVHRFIAKVAASDSTVLLTGASGTGKELVARAIHRRSARARRPFVAINCAAVADSLLESEFFGHERGAFTGAVAQKRGRLEEADGGTVFLDEVGELALPLQAKLLRVLQEREFERVGGSRTIKVSIRVIAATNRDLPEEVKRGTFRQDLFYRLNVVSLTTPALRERRGDIPMLANHFLQKHRKHCARRITGFSDDAMACLVSYDWPGNVRELENAVERAIVLGASEQILSDDLPDPLAESAPTMSGSRPKFHETIQEIKRQLVTKALEEADGNHVQAASRLGLHPNNLHRLIKNLKLR
jgi:Nif-specific regulatory protein